MIDVTVSVTLSTNFSPQVRSNNLTLFETSTETEVFIDLYVVLAILSLLSFVGTVGNALVLYVFFRKRDKLVSTVYIIALACVDFTTCLIIIPFTMYMEYVDFHTPYDVVCKLYQFLITFNIPFSALIMVAIAIDRYFCICHPFARVITYGRAKRIVVGLGCYAAMLGLGVAIMYGVYEMAKSESVSVITNLTYHELLQNLSTGNSSRGFEVPYGLLQDGARGVRQTEDVAYTGHCKPNNLIIGGNIQWYYQKFYSATFLVCFVVVVILYVLIYRSVLQRRRRRQRQKNGYFTQSVSVANDCALETAGEETVLTTMNPEATNRDGTSVTEDEKRQNGPCAKLQKLKQSKYDHLLMANLKTAAMLFVVTVVFIISFLPAFLMALQLITYNIIVFYMYFAYNVANPVIYSFMNKNFRDDLKRIFFHSR